MKVGIDAISYSIPQLQLPIKSLANLRGIDPAKLEKGLGLLNMTIPDVHQDVVTFAANAALKLIKQEGLDPKSLGRIYVATESSVDASKPIASYVLGMLEEKLKKKYGAHNLMHCDVLDMTFACISGVDALHNTLDWIRVNPEEIGMVICTDIAKYDLNSTGEYTQGTGAVAVLLKQNPRIIEIDSTQGISTENVFDFFKPRRIVKKKDIIGDDTNPEWMGVLEEEVEIFKEQPVFEGQYSNECYQARITDAYFKLKKKLGKEEALIDTWRSIILHLPYAFQGRRMFGALYLQENEEVKGTAFPTDANWKEKVREQTKTPAYRAFVEEKLRPSEIASSRIGNIYTGSIFMALLSALLYHKEEGNEISGEIFGFISYGSGSKSKVFQGTIASDWKSPLETVSLFKELDETHELSVVEYEALHKKTCKQSILPIKEEFYLQSIETDNENLIGARYYRYKE